MMRKTKPRPPESSAVAGRLADYKGDLGVGGGSLVEDHGGGGNSSCGGGGGGGNTDTYSSSASATTNSGCGGSSAHQSPSQKESSANTIAVNQHTPPTTAIRDLSIRGMKEKTAGDRQVRVVVDDSKPKPTTKKNKPIQADLDISKEFSRCKDDGALRLDLSNSSITQLPSSVHNLTHLVEFYLYR
ncbi:leucine-rich repeat protein soc-2 homolog [Macrobrachium nipponense]|uniref:leucine-rich repeat protein soc-2 homolog n=1 Tax=Macrobrachium nipponense TaxID=159736 RepID=UPI0030C80523